MSVKFLFYQKIFIVILKKKFKVVEESYFKFNRRKIYILSIFTADTHSPISAHYTFIHDVYVPKTVFILSDFYILSRVKDVLILQ